MSIAEKIKNAPKTTWITNDLSADEIRSIVSESKENHRTLGYRTEQLYGEGYRDAAEVMAYEIFELQNTDILETLRTTILKDTQIGTRMKPIIDGIQNNTDDEDVNAFLELAFNNKEVRLIYTRMILSKIKNATGKDIKYCLWLCDSIQDMKDSYEFGDNVYTVFDAYETSDIVLSDIGSEGKLYGYETMPKPILKPWESAGDSASCSSYEKRNMQRHRLWL